MSDESSINQIPSELNPKIVISDKNKASTAAKKRDRNALSSPEADVPPSKTAAIMPNEVSIESIRTLLQEQTKAIDMNMKTQMDKMSEEIRAEMQTKLNELHEKIDTNQKSMQSQIDKLKNNVDKCMEQASGTDDDMQRMAKLNELKIRGIEHTNQENLNNIFTDIAKLLQFNLSNVNNVPSITRLFKWDNSSKTSKPTPYVIVKFVANHIRNEFYSLYMKKIAAKEPIMSEQINLPQGTRIIISENLTQINSSIFVAAASLKKQNKLVQVFTQNGLVHVKANKSVKATAIRSQRQLELFTAANPCQQANPNVKTTPASSSVSNPPAKTAIDTHKSGQELWQQMQKEQQMKQSQQQQNASKQN